MKEIVDSLTSRFADKKCLVIGGPVVPLVPLAKQLLQVGAQRPLLLSNGVGTGDLPEEDTATWHSLDVPKTSSVAVAFREYEALLVEPDVATQEVVEAYDPEGEALALGAIVLNDVPSVAGRRRYAYRPAAWRELEDKTRVEGLWSEAGIAAPPALVVPCAPEALRDASRSLDRGAGVVWAGDSRDGVHGGGQFVRWVRNATQEQEAFVELSGSCDRLRVTPFLEGIPCSIHGVVLPDGTAALRPIEMNVLRVPGSTRFRYAGASTNWDPPRSDREAMREVARRVGEALRRTVNFKGPFTVDGVLSEEGFLPTELNPRIGAGLNKLSGPLAGQPIELAMLAITEGDDLGVSAKDFENWIVEAADAKRAVTAMAVLDHPVNEPDAVSFTIRDGQLLRVGPEEKAMGSLRIGPSPAGGFLAIQFAEGSIPVGESLGPWTQRAYALADEFLGAKLGPLEHATSVR